MTTTTKNKRLIVIIILALVTILGLVALSNQHKVVHKQPSPSKSATKSIKKDEVDPSIKPIADELHLDTANLKIFYDDSFLTGTTLAFYTTPNVIRVKHSSDNLELKTELSHEYLHFVWFQKLTQVERDSLGASLTTLYQSDSGMQIRMKNYLARGLTIGSSDFSTELNSIYCTESSDQYLSASVLAECNRWINRSALEFRR